jgi:hypothetical protein
LYPYQSEAFLNTTVLFYSAAIGLRGIQLFVDAGIPVDTELVRNLIMDVLQEKVTTMLGYPKPQKHTPPETQEVINLFIVESKHLTKVMYMTSLTYCQISDLWCVT